VQATSSGRPRRSSGFSFFSGIGVRGSAFWARFIGTTSIIPFLPDAWAEEAGGFPIMTLPIGFLTKDVLFLVVSFYLLKRDLTRAAREIVRNDLNDAADQLIARHGG